MKKLRAIFIIGILLSLSGCLIYFVSQPASTVSAGISFKVAVTSLPAQFSISTARATPVVGIEIPDSWSVSSVTYLWGAGGTNPISGIGIFVREESEYMNTNYATKGYVWRCYKGPELELEYLESLAEAYGDMYFTVNVHSGASGTYILRYCAGPGPAGSSCAVECHISNSNLNTRGYGTRLAETDPLATYPDIVQRKIVVNGSAYYLDNWQSCSKPIEYGSLDDVAYGAGSFVAVGDMGEILTSPDGITWTERDSGTEKDLRGVAYGAGSFVAVGDKGEILTSPDGITWTEMTSGAEKDLLGVAYGNGRFVAVGSYGEILTSPDGITWTRRDSGTERSFNGVAYGNGIFVAVGQMGEILTSPDGITWTERDSGIERSLYGVAYGAGTFVAVGSYGEILTSPDGITWTRRDSGTERSLNGVAYGNGIFVAVGQMGEILTSPDGITWTERCSGTSGYLQKVSCGNDTFVAVGETETGFGNAIILMSKHPSTTGGGGGCFISAIE